MEEESTKLVELARWLDGKLAPDARRTAEMYRRATSLAEGLAKSAYLPIVVTRHSFFGSLVKGTAVEPCDDVDVLLELDPEALLTQRGTQRGPRSTVSELKRAVEHLRAGLVAQGIIEVDPQRHSVGVRYPSSHIRVDLVPALAQDRRRSFAIPRRFDEEWIESWPQRDERDLARLAKSHPSLLPAIRLLKSWKRLWGAPLSSYSIEVILSLMVKQARFKDPVALVAYFWQTCAEHNRRQSLHLGAEAARGGLTAVHPRTGENVLPGRDKDHRDELCRLSGGSLEMLADIRKRCFMGRPRWAAGGLSELFVGDHARAEIESIRVGDWYSGSGT